MTETPQLTVPSLQLCLAHYCDVHGPTPLMVTEGIPVDCSQCSSDPNTSPFHLGDRSHSRTGATSAADRSQSQAAMLNESLRVLGLHATSKSDSVPEHDGAPTSDRTATVRPSANATRHAELSPTTEAPDTPRRTGRPAHESHGSRRDSGFGKTYNEFVKQRAIPCENCAMTLPERQDGPTTPTLKTDMRGPTLRTRAPYAKVYGYGDQSPPASRSPAGSDTESEDHRDGPSNHASHASRNNDGSASSSSSSSTSAHTHYLNYTSTHEPLRSESWRIVRSSCLRTLSFEILPRAPNSSAGALATNSPQSPTVPSAQFVTTQSSGAAVSGGSIFFGDPLAGYTTAYIFRIPDVHARGHKRVYALMAVSTHPETVTVKAFAYITSVFQELAQWIQKCAEHEAETAREASPVGPPWHGFQPMGVHEPPADRRSSGNSFLSSGSGLGLTRRMGGGGGGFAPKARGLAELVGLPDIFIQLHRRFVTILLELSLRLNS
jgi:hypothetical protein